MLVSKLIRASSVGRLRQLMPGTAIKMHWKVSYICGMVRRMT
jgi:hypothetical protein